MSQILCWDVNYQPKEKPWSVVNCPNRQKVLDYLVTDSIILVSENVWNQETERRLLILMKVHCLNLRLAVVGKRAKKSNLIVTFLTPSKIEAYIHEAMLNRYTLPPHREMIETAHKLL